MEETKNTEEVQETKTVLTDEQVKEFEKLAQEAYEYKQQYPHRHEKYRPMGEVIRCKKCNATSTLKLASERRQASFKRRNQKSLRNTVPVLDKEGNKIYFCMNCIKEHAKTLNK